MVNFRRLTVARIVFIIACTYSQFVLRYPMTCDFDALGAVVVAAKAK